MGFIIDFIIYCLLAVLIWHLLTRKYLNPYKLTFVFGKKGSGKNTYLTKIAYQHMAKGWRVYSNTPIPGCYEIEPSDIGKFMIPPESVVLLDEVGLIWHSRDHKTFPKHVLRWFKLQRHYHVKVYIEIWKLACPISICKLLGGMPPAAQLEQNVWRQICGDTTMSCSYFSLYSFSNRVNVRA